MPICVVMCPMCPESQKSVSDPLELGTQEVMSCLTWILGTELMSSPKTAGTVYLGIKNSHLEMGKMKYMMS